MGEGWGITQVLQLLNTPKEVYDVDTWFSMAGGNPFSWLTLVETVFQA
jgi:hypothetical protein